MKLFYFDIETGPGDENYLIERFNPVFEPDASIKEPKISSVLKDPAKISAAQEDLAIRRMDWQEAVAKSVQEKRDEWIQQSCLKAERGEIVAIGYSTGKETSISHGAEDKVIRDFLQALTSADEAGYTIAGFNIEGFDLPFIRRRCLVRGIDFELFNPNDKWKPWRFQMFDALKNWQSGNWKDWVKLDDLAKAFGVGAKTGSGADFWKLYRTNQEEALLYLRNDIEMTVGVVNKMI